MNVGAVNWTFHLPQPRVTHTSIAPLPPAPVPDGTTRKRLADNIISNTDAVDLLITQWQESGKMTMLMMGLMELSEREHIMPLQRLEDMRNLDLAEGIWLDYHGERLGRPRPAITGTSIRFGFDGSDGVGFSQAPFSTTIIQLSVRVPLVDDRYRIMLKLRAGELTHDGSIPSIETAIREAFPDAYVVDAADGTMELIVDRTTYDGLIDLITDLDAWPRPAGITLTVA